MPKPIETHIVVITGFRQRSGRATTGLDGLEHRLVEAHNSGDTVVTGKRWDDDFHSLAAKIERCRHGRDVRVIVVAYSWGVGHGAVTLANELLRYGLTVDALFAIDAVYRSWFPVRVRSLFSRGNMFAPKIQLPPNVLACRYWRQISSRPQGHRIIKSLEHQSVQAGSSPEWDGVWPGVTHQTIDNVTEIQDDIFCQIGELLAMRRAA
jgi:hypothetical protein